MVSTPGHKFFANNAWVSAEDLKAGDIIAKYVDKLNNYGLFDTIEDALVVQKQIKMNSDHEERQIL